MALSLAQIVALSGMQKTAILRGMPSYKKILLTLIVLLGIGGRMQVSQWIIPVAHAQSAPISGFNPTASNLNSSNTMAWVLEGLNTIAWVSFDLLDKLLDPAMIFEGEGDANDTEIQDTLNTIWQLSRDIMNIIFAVALVLAAIYTVITANNEMVRSHLGKFVLCVILVNFSWLFSLMVLDFSNMLTAVVLSLPSEVAAQDGDCHLPPPAGSDPSAKGPTCKIVDDVAYFLPEKTPAGAAANADGSPRSIEEATSSKFGYKCTFQIVCVKLKDWSDGQKDTGFHKVLNALVYNYAKLGDIARLPDTSGDDKSSNLQQWVMFNIRQLLVIFILVALAFPLLAMCLAFIIRIPVLWVTIAFMPFVFTYILLQGIVPGVEKIKTTILDNFLGAAFLPAKVSLPLTVGFIMMNAMASSKWSILQSQLKRQVALTGGVTTFFDLIWMAMGLGIMWAGTFAALHDSGGAFAVVGDWVKSAGEGMGKLAAGVPLKARVIPGMGNLTLPQALGYLKNPSAAAGAYVMGGDAKHPGSNLKETHVEKIRDKKSDVQEAIRKAKDGGTTADLEQLKDTINRAAGEQVVTNENIVATLEKLDHEKVIKLDEPTKHKLQEMVTAARNKPVTPPPAAPAAPAAPPAAPAGP